jgi:hypothetical protein
VNGGAHGPTTNLWSVEIKLEWDPLTSDADPDQQLIIYTAEPGFRSEQAFTSSRPGPPRHRHAAPGPTQSSAASVSNEPRRMMGDPNRTNPLVLQAMRRCWCDQCASALRAPRGRPVTRTVRSSDRAAPLQSNWPSACGICAGRPKTLASARPQNAAICSGLRDRTASGFAYGMSAWPVGKPAVDCASTGNKRRRFGGNFYGSDGTRTRDLRRDRPLHPSRRLTTIGAQSLYSCGFAGLARFDSAWLSEADFTRLLPVCCPARASGRSAGSPALAGSRFSASSLPFRSRVR